MKKLSLILAGIFTAIVSHGATVNWHSTIDTGLIESTGAALTAGNYIRIGYFGTLTNAQVTTNALTLPGIALNNADFLEFGNSTVGTGVGGAAGIFNAVSSPLYLLLPGFVPNSQIYFWALKSTNNTSLATALATVTQTAIGNVPSANLATWQFPANDVSATNIDLADLSNANRQILAGTYVAAGNASLNGVLGSPNHALQLATVAVPEPSVLAFSALAALALAGARRRR